jgi:predicted amidohydrolase YtcJ
VLIYDAEIGGRRIDVRIQRGRITEMGQLGSIPGEQIVAASGGALLPGLHDHHLHLAALAARQESVQCGPPSVTNREELSLALAAAGEGWIRGVGYHESVAGLPTAAELDQLRSDRPVRIQHRSGRMWLLNSQALETLLSRTEPPRGLEREGGRFTGRLFDEDTWLRRTLGAMPPDLTQTSALLASVGVTGVTEMSPANGSAEATYLDSQLATQQLVQRLMLAGSLELACAQPGPWTLGPAKLHLHEAALPEPEAAVAFVRAAHLQGRSVAIHCTTEVELVYTLATCEAAGDAYLDRIEHGSIAGLEHIDRIAALGMAAVANQLFVRERGDRYLADVEPREVPDLYRLRAFKNAGVVLAGGSDAPFVSPDPWAAMKAAVERRTSSGVPLGLEEALTPEEALALYLADPSDLSQQREIAVSGPADLCLLDRPWGEARQRLSASDVRMTIVAGEIVHQRVDQPPS